jgi:hypothetical protein
MSITRQKILDDITTERDRQYQLPGSEYDQKHSINDWIAISTQYIGRCAQRKHLPTSIEDQRDSLIKAAAVIVAALEHLDNKNGA